MINEMFHLEQTRRFAVFSAIPDFPRAKDGAVVIDAGFLSSRQGVVTGLGIGDSKLLLDVAGEENLFERVRDECSWNEMYHKGSPVPRLVCMQGTFLKDGNSAVVGEPVYRHPADSQPPMASWTPTVDAIRRATSKALGGQPINHALIQWYRDGHDYISEHADKTLDITRGSAIVNVSLGATRTMVLRAKKGFAPKAAAAEAATLESSNIGVSSSSSSGSSSSGSGGGRSGGATTARGSARIRPTQRVDLPNGSLFALGWGTNLEMTHEIRQDKRLARDKSGAELSFGGHRISLTFRSVATYQRHADGQLFGQGAKAKREDDLDVVLGGGGGDDGVGANGGGDSGSGGGGALAAAASAETAAAETNAMVGAFGLENRDPQFDWQAAYGNGFSVMNMSSATNSLVTDATATATADPSKEIAGGGEKKENGEEEEEVDTGRRRCVEAEDAVKEALRGGLPYLTPSSSSSPSSLSGAQQEQQGFCALRPLTFFCAWNGVLCMVFDGFPPALAQLKERLNATAAATVICTTTPTSPGSSSSSLQSLSPPPHSFFKGENFGSKWPKATLAALSDRAPPLTLQQLQKLRRLCVIHAQHLTSSSPQQQQQETTTTTTTSPLQLEVSELSVVHYSQRSLEKAGNPSIRPLPLLLPSSSNLIPTAPATTTPVVACAPTSSSFSSTFVLPPDEVERARALSVVSEWLGGRLSAYLAKVNAPGSRISSYRNNSPKGSTLVARLGLVACTTPSPPPESNTKAAAARTVEGTGSAEEETPRSAISSHVAAFRAAVDAEFPGFFAWLDPASLHCTVRSLDRK